MKLVIAMLFVSLVVPPPTFARDKPSCAGRITVVWSAEVWKRLPETLAGVEQAILYASLGTLVTFPERPGNIADLASRGILETVDCIVEIYSARVTYSNQFSGQAIAFTSASVRLGLRFLRVLGGQALEVIGFVETGGSATASTFSLIGSPGYIDTTAVVAAAFRNAALKTLCVISGDAFAHCKPVPNKVEPSQPAEPPSRSP